jgi:metal-responsive CopG/Arc/MetJ family transcriptional regulator
MSQILKHDLGRNIIIHLNESLIEKLNAIARNERKTRAAIIRRFLWNNINDEIEEKYNNKKKEKAR